MYEKGFGAMEKSHQRAIVEMRRVHRQELDNVRQEMHQLLKEEADATQAGFLHVTHCLHNTDLKCTVVRNHI